MGTPRLSLRNVSKSFENTAALRGVSFDVLPGEVHVLAGENGAGKSTLIKVLSGVYQDYLGELRVEGELVRLSSPADAVARGIATIYQELSLVPSLSVVDNLILGAPGRALAPISRTTARSQARALLASMGLELDPDAPVETLPLVDRQLLEIARALSRNAQVFVMDEPTSALGGPEVERFFREVERLVARGAGVVYISHRLEEIYRLAQRITVLRDGEAILTRPASELSSDELVAAMLGRADFAAGKSAPVSAPSGRAPRLLVSNLSCPATPLNGVSFQVLPGEILGVAGLRGSGAVELLQTLVANPKPHAANLLLDGSPYAPSNPADALARGVALLAGDRGLSVFPQLDVVQNATLSSLRRYERHGLLDEKLEHADVARESAKLALRAGSLRAPAGTLSGGNQQKVALLRCLLTKPRVLLLDDPTRGIDVAAKAEIHTLLRGFARSGAALLFYGSDLEELCSLCDRVIVLFRGGIAGSFDRNAVRREQLLASMMGAAA